MCEESRKIRIAIDMGDFITTITTTAYLTEERIKEYREHFAMRYEIPTQQVLVYRLGTEEQDENGTLFFCPKCGEYNEHGWDPQVEMFYTHPKDGGPAVPAGYYKYLQIDCDDCGTFEISCDKFNKEMETLNKEFEQHESSRSNEEVKESD